MNLTDDQKRLLKLVERIMDRGEKQQHTPKPGQPFQMIYFEKFCEEYGCDAADHDLKTEWQRSIPRIGEEETDLTLRRKFREARAPIRNPTGFALYILRNDVNGYTNGRAH